MGCSACGGASVVVKTDTTAPLFRLTGWINPGARVEVFHRSGYAGFGIVRRVYLQSNLEQVDIWMESSQSMISATPAKGDRIEAAEPAPVRR